MRTRTTAHIFARVAMIGALLFGFAACRAEDTADQKSFPSPEDAFKALLDGMNQNSDSILLDVLGHQNKDLVVQTDKEETAAIRKKICAAAQEHLAFVTEGDKTIAHLGIKDWPYPFPLVKKGDAWIFDTAAGKEELINRRIGRNELHAIKLVEAYEDAQRMYATKDHTGDKVLKYAQKLFSAKGKQDGLYWTIDPAANQETSPLNDAFDEAPEFREANGADVPYFGYFFKILTKQGGSPPNGKYDYVINGNMIAGFALVAWPADYGSSGIMSFVISHHGVLFEKDLGADTAKLAAAMDEYNPDNTWSEVKAEDK